MRHIPLFIVLLSWFFVRPAHAADKTFIIFNNTYKGAISLDISGDYPCLTHSLLEEWGVRKEIVSRLAWNAAGCLTRKSATQFHFQFWYSKSAGLLTLLFPKNTIIPQQNGVVTSRWDDGINAFFTNYRVDLDHLNTKSQWDTPGNDASLNLDSGLNVGAWRLRYQNTFWHEQTGDQGSYTRSYSLWRSIQSMRSRFTLGDGTTSAAMFEALSFRGISLASNQAMFPDRWRPSSPWINGYAHTDAEVTIHQNGLRVYRIHVPAGSFSIKDFYPPDPQGDLEITIQEDDGTEKTRIIPWSVMPNLTGENIVSYELVAGRFQPYTGNDSDKDRFIQSTFSWGAGPGLTLYAGGQQGENYASQVVGLGKDLYALGALSVDFSAARYRQKGENNSGTVWRLRYSKAFLTTQTHLNAQLQAWPHGSQYRTMEEKIDRADSLRYGWDDDTVRRAVRGQFEVNQNFSEDSTLSLSWDWTRSRMRHGSHQSLTLNVDTRFNDMDISMYAGRERDLDDPTESVFGFSISIPFSMGSQTPNIGYLADLSSRDKNSNGVNLYGAAMDDYSLTYDVTAKHTIHGDDELEATTGYQYNTGEANFGVTRNSTEGVYHADVSGSVLVYSKGVTFGQQLGDTAALVRVPHTAGVSFYNQFGAKTNDDGDLLVSYMTPWRVNTITVDSLNLPDNVHLQNDELEVVPTEGAIVERSFLPVN